MRNNYLEFDLWCGNHHGVEQECVAKEVPETQLAGGDSRIMTEEIWGGHARFLLTMSQPQLLRSARNLPADKTMIKKRPLYRRLRLWRQRRQNCKRGQNSKRALIHSIRIQLVS